VSAFYGGRLITQDAYPTLGVIAGVSLLVAVVLPVWLFRDEPLRKKGM